MMTRTGEVASFETIDAEINEVDGTQARLRPQDHVDAAALHERFSLKDGE